MSSLYPNHGNSSYNGPPSTSAYPITSYSSLGDWDGSQSKGPSQTDHPASATTLAPATPTASRSYQAHQSSSTDTQNPPPATDHHSIPPFMVHDGYPPSTTGVRTTYSGAHHFPGGSSHAAASGVGVGMSTHGSAYGPAGGHAPAPVQDSDGATTNATYSAGPPVPAEGDPKSVSEILEEAYTAGHIKPSYDKRMELAGTTGLPLDCVTEWFSSRRSLDPDYDTWWHGPQFGVKKINLDDFQKDCLEGYLKDNGRAPPIRERAQLAKELGMDSANIYMWSAPLLIPLGWRTPRLINDS
ncbi:hypothetical protein OH76DRAFT_1561176 [Lentinus brumalis]|uniref:Homeobox domain-containing protein n=1 Tax=Lentinus brumalis TaxID=2498619 RepID=A0A371CP23_9APHY|nr:hypothetical protein OH76DRAFT_1561176 [Polyporus brumalis]